MASLQMLVSFGDWGYSLENWLHSFCLCVCQSFIPLLSIFPFSLCFCQFFLSVYLCLYQSFLSLWDMPHFPSLCIYIISFVCVFSTRRLLFYIIMGSSILFNSSAFLPVLSTVLKLSSLFLYVWVYWEYLYATLFCYFFPFLILLFCGWLSKMSGGGMVD